MQWNTILHYPKGPRKNIFRASTYSQVSNQILSGPITRKHPKLNQSMISTLMFIGRKRKASRLKESKQPTYSDAPKTQAFRKRPKRRYPRTRQSKCLEANACVARINLYGRGGRIGGLVTLTFFDMIRKTSSYMPIYSYYIIFIARLSCLSAVTLFRYRLERHQ